MVRALPERVCVSVCVTSLMAMHPVGMGRYDSPALNSLAFAFLIRTLSLLAIRLSIAC